MEQSMLDGTVWSLKYTDVHVLIVFRDVNGLLVIPVTYDPKMLGPKDICTGTTKNGAMNVHIEAKHTVALSDLSLLHASITKQALTCIRKAMFKDYGMATRNEGGSVMNYLEDNSDVIAALIKKLNANKIMKEAI